MSAARKTARRRRRNLTAAERKRLDRMLLGGDQSYRGIALEFGMKHETVVRERAYVLGLALPSGKMPRRMGAPMGETR